VNAVAPMVASLMELGFIDTPTHTVNYDGQVVMHRRWQCLCGRCTVQLPDCGVRPFHPGVRQQLVRMLACQCEELLQ
jgi:hypothetical protein